MGEKGLVHIYTGEGKGKTTAALGLAVRAAGAGLKVLFVQFFKEDGAESGEKNFLRALEGFHIELLRSNCRHPYFTREKTDPEMVKRAIRTTFDVARRKVASGEVDLLVLDEVFAAVKGEWIEEDDLHEFIKERPEGVEVVLTGRDAPVEIIKTADYVTEMLKIKHPFDAGTPARKGIEF